MLLVTLKVQLHIVTKSFCSNIEIVLVDIYLPKSKQNLLGIYKLPNKSDFVKHINNVFTGNGVLQAFINYDFLYTRFYASKTILRARPCMWEIMHIKEKTYTLLIITFRSRNYTKLVFKPLAAKKGLSISVLCTAPSC